MFPYRRKASLFRRKPPLPPLLGYFVENFTGVNDASLASRTPPKAPNANTISVRTGSFAIGSNRGEARFPAQNSAIITFNLGVTDFISTAKVIFPATGTQRIADVLCRYVDNSNYWAARLNLDSQLWRLGKNVANTFSFGANSQTLPPGTVQAGVEYTIEITCVGNVITARVYGLEGASVFTVTDAAHNTATQGGLRAQNTVAAGAVVFDDWKMELPPSADATALTAVSVLTTSQMRTAMTIVDNNLMFSSGESQKALARQNLNGKLHDLGFFVDSFGHGQAYASWNGLGELPEPDLSSVNTDLATNHNALGAPRLHAYLWRLPWQRTGTYNTTTGAVAPNDSGDYNSENRRWLPDYLTDATTWARKVARKLINDWGVTFFHAGSELKGYQGYTTPQRWDWLAFYNWFVALRTGVREGATDEGLNPDNVYLIAPYPVVAHQGVSDADSVTADSYNDSTGAAVNFSYLNNNNVTYGGIGFVNRAPLQAVDEFLRLCDTNDIPLPYFGVDFGTFNNDNNPTTGIDDFDLAYRRFKQHIQWYKERLAARGFASSKIVLSEWYAKAQYDMSVAGDNFIEESLRAQYQASIKACAFYAMLEEGVHLPMIWSPFGRGDQSTDSGDSADPMQWYGGMVKRTVSNNNNHGTSVMADGGEAQPFLDVVSAIHDYFSEGVALYPLTFSDTASWKGIATATKALVTNKLGTTETLSINNRAAETFTAYQTRLISLV